MRVLLVFPDFAPSSVWTWPGAYHHGLASISASLKQAGHETSLVHLRVPVGREEFTARVKQASPDLVGFTTTTNFAPIAREMIGWIADGGARIPILVGGMHATLAPDEVAAWTGVNHVCVGEGERSVVELCERLSASASTDHIAGIRAGREGHDIGSEVRPEDICSNGHKNAASSVENLDELPFGDRELFDYGNLVNESQGMATVMASRGCPFKCSYCCNHALSQAYGGRRYVRFRSVDHVLRELEQIRDRYSFIKGFHFDDDILFLRREWFSEFTTEYKRRIGMPFSCNYRVGVADAVAIPMLSEAGCQHLQIGIESGNDWIRTQILGRSITSDQIVKAVDLAHHYGINVEANSMVGIPEETTRTMLDTVKLNARVRPDRSMVAILYPFPRTRMHEYCIEHGYLAERTTTSFFLDSVLDLPTLSREQILMFRRFFPYMLIVYRRLRGLRPPLLQFTAEKVADSILSLGITARLANLAYSSLKAIGPRWLRRPTVFLGKTSSKSSASETSSRS